jgi:GNAT superfamily N-acetyltransferase
VSQKRHTVQLTVDDATAADIPSVAELFREYFADPVQGPVSGDLQSEIDALPHPFSPPGGRLLVARLDSSIVGCVGMRPLSDGVCEMKRMFVRPGSRGWGAGRALAEAVIAGAARGGYVAMRLDTKPNRTAAVALYRSLGFAEIPRYWDCPVDEMVFMELALQAPNTPRTSSPG